MSALPEPERPLSPSEIDSVLRNFSGADWARAKSIARLLARGLASCTADDLLQETLTKLLEGERVWHASLAPLVVIKTAMHSVASNIRKHDSTGPIDAMTDAVSLVADESAPNPEDVAIAGDLVRFVEEAVGPDDDLQMLLMAWTDGLRGATAAAELGWDEKTYEAARKRLMRRIGELAPDRRKT